MAQTDYSGPVNSTAGFIGNLVGNVVGNVVGALTGLIGTAAQGAVGAYNQIVGQKTGIADNTATKLFTITIPNVNAGAGGRVLVTSITTLAGHIGDIVRTVEYLWSVERVAGNVAVMTISIVTGGSVVAVTGAGGGLTTFTSTLGAAAVSGGATASNSFDIQITNTGSTATTSTSTFFAEVLNALTGGVTIA